MTRTILIIAFALYAVPEAQGSGVPFLIASTAADTGGSCSGTHCGPTPTEIKFHLAWTDNVGGWAALGEDESPWWSLDGGQTGDHVFTPGNTSGFDGFVTHLTDGMDDSLGRGYALSSGISGMEFSSESSAFGTDTDLIDFDIESIRLVVDELTLTSDPTSYAFSADVTWEFWGVPEPGTLSLLTLAGLAVVRRRRLR